METTLLIRLRSFCTINSVEGLLPISDVALIPKQSFRNTSVEKNFVAKFNAEICKDYKHIVFKYSELLPRNDSQ